MEAARRYQAMPMTEKDRPQSPDRGTSQILKDERLAALASAYLDKQLDGVELEEFEALLREDEALAREISELQRIEDQLSKMGGDILSEPIPETLLDALSQLPKEKAKDR